MFLSLTFDYELFFGENNGNYDEVLFDYTYKLIDELEKKGVSATFFADVCSIPIAKQYNQTVYTEGFTKQIQYMMLHGQDVQLHLHPHWYNSKWNGEQWEFTNYGYRLHDFEKIGKIEQIVSDGIQFLNDSLKPVNKDYRCIAYRAGGFSFQPHQRIISVLYDNGIRVDSSVAPQLYADTDAHYYDYRHKLEKLNWYISKNSDWWKNCKDNKSLFEIPIATVKKNPVSFAFWRLLKPKTMKLRLSEKRGTYISVNNTKQNKLSILFKYFTGYNVVSLDAFKSGYLYKQIQDIHKKNNYSSQIIAIIGHPKLVNNEYIKNLCDFIDLIKVDKRFKLLSINDAYRMMEKKNDSCKDL